ncbi:hypothetical protein D3C87_1685060 [compost metagenome]
MSLGRMCAAGPSCGMHMKAGALMARASRPALWGAVTWAATLAEHALLIAWKGWAIVGAGNVLIAWVVLAGLCGIGFVAAAPRPVRSWRGFGWHAVAVLDAALALALFWFGHGLLGVLWLAWLIGGLAFDRRCRAMCEGRSHG